MIFYDEYFLFSVYSPTNFVESSRTILWEKNRFRTIDAAIWKFTHIHHYKKVEIIGEEKI
jgi:hypothetical protein